MIEQVKQAAAPAQVHKPGGAGVAGTSSANGGFDAELLLALLPGDSGGPAAELDTDAGAAQQNAGAPPFEGDAQAQAPGALAQEPGPVATDPGPVGPLASGALAQVMMALRGTQESGQTGGNAAPSGAEPDASVASGMPASTSDDAAGSPGRAATDGTDFARGTPSGTQSTGVAAAGDAGHPARSTPDGALPAGTDDTAKAGTDRTPKASAAPEVSATGTGRAAAAVTATATAATVTTTAPPTGNSTPTATATATASSTATIAAAAATGSETAPGRSDRMSAEHTEASAAVGAAGAGTAPRLPSGPGTPRRSPNAAAAPHRAGGPPSPGTDPNPGRADAANLSVGAAPASGGSTDLSNAARDAPPQGATARTGQAVEARPGNGTRRAPPASSPGITAGTLIEPTGEYAQDKVLAVAPDALPAGDTLDFGGQSTGQREQGPLGIIAAGLASTGALQSSSPAQAAVGTAPAQFSLAIPVDRPGFHAAFAGQIESLVLQGLQSAEIVVTPRDMGPIRVELSMSGDSLSVAFSAAHPETTRVIEQSLGTLRTMLSDQGITLSQASVGSGAFGQPQDRGAARSTSNLFRNRGAPVLEQAGSVLEGSSVPPPRSRGPGTIDLFA